MSHISNSIGICSLYFQPPPNADIVYTSRDRPTPPNSAYCVHRSLSTSSAHKANCRRATSPGDSLPLVVLVCYEPASATDERCEPVIYYPNPQSLVITEFEWSYSKESLRSVDRGAARGSRGCEGAAGVDHLAVEDEGKSKSLQRNARPNLSAKAFSRRILCGCQQKLCWLALK